MRLHPGYHFSVSRFSDVSQCSLVMLVVHKFGSYLTNSLMLAPVVLALQLYRRYLSVHCLINTLRLWLLSFQFCFWMYCILYSWARYTCIACSTAVAAILRGPGGQLKDPPHFPEWGVTYKAVTPPPSFDAMLMSLFSLYVLVMDGDGCRRWSSSALI